MEFILQEFGKKEILSVYKRFLTKFFDGVGSAGNSLISEAAVRWLIAGGLYEGYGLYDDKKHLICFGLFIKDMGRRALLLDYFAVLKKYRGYNYPEIFFELLKDELILTDTEDNNNKFPVGIFMELRGVDTEESEQNKRQREFNFYGKIGAYLTDIIAEFPKNTYNIMFLPVNDKPARTELKRELISIYKNIVPSFEPEKITRLTEEVDGLI